MTSLLDIAEPYDVIVLDQWGVLHDGTRPYSGAPEAMIELAQQGKRLAILSNSGKRGTINADRIAKIGLPMQSVEQVMTSGEAFWLDCIADQAQIGQLYAITGSAGDAERWAGGMRVTFASQVAEASHILLMGLPEGSDGEAEERVLDEALERNLPVICTNPDKASPRADGSLQRSPGALAYQYEQRGGHVTYYGKPHAPIFKRLLADLKVKATQCLMVGDSLEHDVAGAQGVGMDSAFVTSGLYATHFAGVSDKENRAAHLATDYGCEPPTYVIDRLS